MPETSSHRFEMELFDKKTLTKVIFCAALMSAIDGDVDQTEWDIIHDFVQERWKREFGEFRTVRVEIIKNLKGLLKNGKVLNEKLDQLTALLSTHLNAAQKRVLVKLVERVMMADGKMKKQEEQLFDRFMNILEKR